MPDQLQLTHEDPIEHRPYNGLLTDTIKQVDLVHTTLVGMAGIVILLYGAALLPVLDKQPVTDKFAAVIMGIAAFSGLVVLALINLRVHKHITDHARLTEVLVNSLGQGFLSFDKNGLCGEIYSQACRQLLEITPARKSIAEVLHITADAREDFMGWIQVLFDPTHALGFDDAVRFLPQTFPHSNHRNIKLDYKPIRDAHDALTQVVVIATDRTEEIEALRHAEERQNFASMICKIFKERNQFITTIRQVRDFIAFLGRDAITPQDMSHIMRQLHTLKAAVRHFDLHQFGTLLHDAESRIRQLDTSDAAILASLSRDLHDTIAAEFARVLTEVRELIGIEEEQRGTIYEIEEDIIYRFADQLRAANIDTSTLTFYHSQIAAIPIRQCFLGFERELIELAQEMDKNLKPVNFVGGELRVLARPWKDFFFALTHISRNIIDHGIEPPVTRLARRKDAAGQITVTTKIEGQDLVITISDDGAGIDPSRIRQKLASIDPEGAWRFEDDAKLIQRVFNWGISTRDGVSEISGRGVGLEAVALEVERLGGSVAVTSEIYQGTSFTLRLPYPLAA
jgi:two-component system, chemotaxis family, sensor kinase CheA